MAAVDGRQWVLIVTVIVLLHQVTSYPIDPIEQEDDHPHLSLVSWRWKEVRGYLVVTLFLLTAAAIKICYHHSHSLHTHVPESCVLIVLGTIVGVVIHLTDIKGSIPTFSSERFFFILLPPIILESAYSLHDKTFFNSIRTILLYAVAGTLINVFLVGSSLFVVEQFGWFGREDIPLVECFTFSTLISAVDPVAVLAIFQELGVNKSLYFLVFGESLLNDAVVITLYNMVTTFAVSRVISTWDVVIGILNFVTVSGGGLVIGVLVGAITALVTRVTNDVRVVEPLIVVALAYFSYVFAELFHFSGIIALIACGLMQAEYVKDNISVRSFTTIKYFTKTLSSVSDVIIFYFLGRVLIRDDHVWDTGFVFFSTFFCIVYRFVSVFLLTYFANKKLQRVRPINFEEQLLMAYGGLRGAIAFSLATLLEEAHVKHARIFITTSLFIVLFTVFVLGSTTKPVVRWLEVQLHVHQETMMFGEITDKMMETVMAGIEVIGGYRSVNYWNQKMLRFNEKYMKNILTHGEGHSFKDTFDILKNLIPHRDRKTDMILDANAIEVIDDDVFKAVIAVEEIAESGVPILIPPVIAQPMPHVSAKKKASFKSSIGHLTRIGSSKIGAGSRTSRSSLEDKEAGGVVTDSDRRTLANAFNRSMFYGVPEKDDVDDEREQRAKRQASDKQRKNRWTSARSRLETMATADQPSTSADGQVETSEEMTMPSDHELAPLRRLLMKKRSSFFASVAEGALLKKRDEEEGTVEVETSLPMTAIVKASVLPTTLTTTTAEITPLSVEDEKEKEDEKETTAFEEELKESTSLDEQSAKDKDSHSID